MEYPKNYWYPILESHEVKRKPVKIMRFSTELVLFRKSAGELVCLPDQCPHRGTSLALGQVIDGCIECPMHGFRYNEDGKCVLIPANGDRCEIPSSLKTRRYRVREVHNLIWFWWGDDRSELPEVPWPKELTLNPPRYWSQGSWRSAPVSFYRTMEANLDIIHFPFTHRPSPIQAFLMRRLGIFKKMDLGPICDLLSCHVKNETIDMIWRLHWGKNSKNPLPGPMRLWMHFPNQLVVEIPSWSTLGYFGCSPIDEHTTFWAARYYQGFINIPILGDIVAWLFLRKYVLGIITDQDLRLQVTQRPKTAGWEGDHLAAKGDQGIAEYWKLVQRSLKKEKPTEQHELLI